MSHVFTSTPCVVRREPPRCSDSFLKRLVAFYSLQTQFTVELSDIWSTLKIMFEPFIKALESSDYDGINGWFQSTITDTIDATAFAAKWNRQLLMAATALGVIPRFNNFQAYPLFLSHVEVLSKVESAVGCSLSHPGYSGDLSVIVGDQNYQLDALNAVCALANLSRTSCWPPGVMLEVGAGHGMVAWLALRMLPHDLYYHIIDLPFISVLQAYQLWCAYGEDVIWLSGEPAKLARVFIHGLVKPELDADIALNQNSLPEFTQHEQFETLAYIEESLREGGLFVSINQESGRGGQRRVAEAVKSCPWLKLIQRSPAWDMEPNYVEEVFVKL